MDHSKEPQEARFSRKLALALSWVTLTFIVFALLILAPEVLLLVFAGVLGGVFLSGITDWIGGKTGLPWGWSLAVTGVFLSAVLTGMAFLIAPSVIQQFTELQGELPRSLESFRGWLSSRSWGRTLLESISGSESSLIPSRQTVARAFGVTSTLFGFLGSALIVLFLSVYLAADPALYKRGFLRLLPARHKERALALLQELYSHLGWWILGRLSAMALVGGLVYAGLQLLGVPLAPALALIAALLDFVPNFGPVLAALPAVLIGLSQGVNTALYVAALYSLVQVLEAYIFTPLILKKAVDLPPAFTITVQVLMGIVAGPLGLVMGGPVAVLLMVAVRFIYVEQILEEPSGNKSKEERAA